MTRAQANYWLRKIYRMLQEAEEDDLVRMRLNRHLKWYGEVIPGDTTFMVINPTKKGFISSILHECVHLCDIDMDEDDVLALEADLFDLLTDRQLGNLLKRVAILI